MFEVHGEQVPRGEQDMVTPSLSPLKEAAMEQSASKRRIITDLQPPSQPTDRQRMIDI